MCSFFFTETWRVAGQGIWKFFFIIDGINEFTNHGMLRSTNQIQILTFDFIHHGIHFIKTHNTGYNIAPNHKWWYTVCESTVNHEISCIRNNCRMYSCNVSHQIVEAISRNFSCCVQINTMETIHDIGMIWDFKIRNNRLTKFFNFYVTGIIFSNRNGWVYDVWNCHHNPGNLFL